MFDRGDIDASFAHTLLETLVPDVQTHELRNWEERFYRQHAARCATARTRLTPVIL